MALTPTYADEVKVVNKITLLPHTDEEYTYLLEPHIGKVGRKKDARLIAFLAKARAAAANDAEFMQIVAEDENFDDIAIETLDLDRPEHVGIADKLSFQQVMSAFMDAIDFRSGVSEEAEEALKKSKPVKGGKASQN